MKWKHKSQGFTLIEALVALLVLALVLLGVAAMQTQALQGAHLSYQRTVATLAAQDMVERLWIQLGTKAADSANPSAAVCPEASEEVGGETILHLWHLEWSEFIPTLVEDINNTVVRSGCKYTVTVQWQDDRFLGEEVSSLVYVTSLFGEES